MPLLETKGAGSAQGFGLSLGGEEAVYVEDVFSTYLYTGTGATQTITNGIDLAGEGGLVWTKSRTEAGRSHALFDTARGINAFISSNLTSNFTISPSGDAIASFNANGYTLGADTGNWGVNNSANGNLASWTFRKQPKFFDVVTYTGNDSSDRQIAHLLGSTPGCVIIKETSGAKNWGVWHRSFSSVGDHMYLNTTGAVVNNTVAFGSNLPTSSVFNVGAFLNSNGATYVAYLFAHDAGGFGLTGLDNVISCGSFSAAAPPQLINLGWEAQFILVKKASGSSDWFIIDVMRGASVRTSGASTLSANSSAAEVANNLTCYPDAQGFRIEVGDGDWIYIAIRRGPMKVPTSGTEVFSPASYTGVTGGVTVTTNFPVDMVINQRQNGTTAHDVFDRLRGADYFLGTSNTNAEAFSAGLINFQSNTSIKENDYGTNPLNTSCTWMFRRAPGFFDEVCWSATAASTQNHNLQVVPELAIFKYRTSSSNWWVYSAPVGLGAGRGMYLNGIDSSFSGNQNPITAISSTTFTTGLFFGGGGNWVTYLFATLAGVSKVGSYTGTGTTQVINCGFTAGARFVLIKRTDSTGDWYVWDSARGIVAGNDPYLLLNSTAAEVTSTDYIDTASTGFEISSTAPAAINASGGSYIFLAIA